MLFLGIFNPNGYMYEHGADLLAAIGTISAVIISLSSVHQSNKKEKQENQNKNNKTLELIDLLSQKHNDLITLVDTKIKTFKNSTQAPITINQGPSLYEIDISNIDQLPEIVTSKNVDTLYTKFHSIYFVLETYLYLKDINIINKINLYIDDLNNALIVHHLNLSSHSLILINNKLKHLSDLKNSIRNLDLHRNKVINSVLQEMGLFQSNIPSHTKYDLKILTNSSFKISSFYQEAINKNEEQVNEIQSILSKCKENLYYKNS